MIEDTPEGSRERERPEGHPREVCTRARGICFRGRTPPRRLKYLRLEQKSIYYNESEPHKCIFIEQSRLTGLENISADAVLTDRVLRIQS